MWEAGLWEGECRGEQGSRPEICWERDTVIVGRKEVGHLWCEHECDRGYVERDERKKGIWEQLSDGRREVWDQGGIKMSVNVEIRNEICQWKVERARRWRSVWGARRRKNESECGYEEWGQWEVGGRSVRVRVVVGVWYCCGENECDRVDNDWGQLRVCWKRETIIVSEGCQIGGWEWAWMWRLKVRSPEGWLSGWKGDARLEVWDCGGDNEWMVRWGGRSDWERLRERDSYGCGGACDLQPENRCECWGEQERLSVDDWKDQTVFLLHTSKHTLWHNLATITFYVVKRLQTSDQH